MAQVKSLTINGKDIVDLIYPVGSFYLSTESTPPPRAIWRNVGTNKR